MYTDITIRNRRRGRCEGSLFTERISRASDILKKLKSLAQNTSWILFVFQSWKSLRIQARFERTPLPKKILCKSPNLVVSKRCDSGLPEYFKALMLMLYLLCSSPCSRVRANTSLASLAHGLRSAPRWQHKSPKPTKDLCLMATQEAIPSRRFYMIAL